MLYKFLEPLQQIAAITYKFVPLTPLHPWKSNSWGLDPSILCPSILFTILLTRASSIVPLSLNLLMRFCTEPLCHLPCILQIFYDSLSLLKKDHLNGSKCSFYQRRKTGERKRTFLLLLRHLYGIFIFLTILIIFALDLNFWLATGK